MIELNNMSKKERKYPKWMQKGAVGEAINNIVSKNQSESASNPLGVKSRSRSSFLNEDESPQESPPKYNLDDLPLVEFSGKIHYLCDFYSIAEAFETLLKKVVSRDGEEWIPCAFDMEWTFNFKTGAEKTSLIQICIDLEECFLFHLPMLKKFPASMLLFLNHPKVLFNGVNIKNDFRKLERDFPNIKADPLIEKCIELGVFFNEVFNSSGRWSMERLVLQTLRLKIDKSRQVRCSKWHIFPLSKKQQLYAAIDVFVSILIPLLFK